MSLFSTQQTSFFFIKDYKSSRLQQCASQTTTTKCLFASLYTITTFATLWITFAYVNLQALGINKLVSVTTKTIQNFSIFLTNLHLKFWQRFSQFFT